VAKAARSWSSYRSEPLIAWAKMVGFDVTPVTEESATSVAKAPLSSSSRESVSSQIETPALRSSARRFMPRSCPGRVVRSSSGTSVSARRRVI
jgi:hypothetical protein